MQDRIVEDISHGLRSECIKAMHLKMVH